MSGVEVRVLSLTGDLLARASSSLESRVADLHQQLLEAGEQRICALVRDECVLPGSSTLREASFDVGINHVTAIFKPRDSLEQEGFSLELLMRADADAAARRAAHHLKSCGYTVGELRATGYTAGELRRCLDSLQKRAVASTHWQNICRDPNLTGSLLLSAGFSVAEMLEAGFYTSHLRIIGCSLASFQASNVPVEDIIQAGFTALEFLECGYTLQQLQKMSFSAGQLKNAQRWPLELRAAGYTATQLKMAGYSLAQVREAFSLQELVDAGYTAWVLGKSGFSMKELRSVGFGDAELANAGFEVLSHGSARASLSSNCSAHTQSSTLARKDRVQQLGAMTA